VTNPMTAIAQKYSARGFILNGSERLTTASTDWTRGTKEQTASLWWRCTPD